MSRRKYDYAAIAAAYAAGMSYPELRKNFGADSKIVTRAIDEAGIPRRGLKGRKTKPRKYDHDGIAKAYAAGASYREITHKFNCPESIIRYAAKLAGHKPRVRNEVDLGKTDDEIEAMVTATSYRATAEKLGIKIGVIIGRMARVRRSRAKMKKSGPEPESEPRQPRNPPAPGVSQYQGCSSLVGLDFWV